MRSHAAGATAGELGEEPVSHGGEPVSQEGLWFVDNGRCGQWLWSGGNERAQLKSRDGRGWDVARGVGVEPHAVSLHSLV